MGSITPGRITAVWLILRCLGRLGGRVDPEELRNLARRSSLRGGGLPIADGFRLSLRGGLILQEGRLVRLSSLGLNALKLVDEDEPNSDVRRLLTSVLILRDPPSWVAFWQGSPGDVELVIPDAERQMLVDAGLYPQPNSSSNEILVRGWWQALGVVPIPEETASSRKAVGDAGEELSYRYEQERLTREGFPDLAKSVHWVAQESSAYGFDLASYVGLMSSDVRPETPLAIEVKSTSYPCSQTFPLHLTVHEWDTAQALSPRYVFHLWDGVRFSPDAGARSQTPVLLSSESIRHHLARKPACIGGCRWEQMLVEMPLEAMSVIPRVV